MNKPALKSALCTGGSLICEFIIKVLDISIFRNKNKQCDSAVNEMLFYGAEDEKESRQIRLNNMLCIHYVILQASSTVDVCVPNLASDTLAKCLVSVQQKNKVNIRIAIHNSDDFHNLQLLAQNGIEVKVIRQGVGLAHEFILLDAGASDALALAGALAGAGAGLEGAGAGLEGAGDGLEGAGAFLDDAGAGLVLAATLLTSDSALITALSCEFERVWNSVTDLPSAKDDKLG